MRSLAMLLAAAALGLTSALLAACGDRSGLIPPEAAADLGADLDDASAALSDQQCREAQRAVSRARASAQELPDSVDPALRRNVEDGLAHVSERVARDCAPKTTPTVTTPTTTAPTTTRPATETAPPPTPTQTTPTPPPAPPPGPGTGGTPPEQDGGDDNGGGGGDGGGGGGGRDRGEDGNGSGGSSAG